jgi:hypothetical protein
MDHEVEDFDEKRGQVEVRTTTTGHTPPEMCHVPHEHTNPPLLTLVQVTVRSHARGNFDTLQCQYLVACDGANSKIRKVRTVLEPDGSTRRGLTRDAAGRGLIACLQHAGISMEGLGELQHLLNVHFSSSSLAKALEPDRPAMLHFVYNKVRADSRLPHIFTS